MKAYKYFFIIAYFLFTTYPILAQTAYKKVENGKSVPSCTPEIFLSTTTIVYSKFPNQNLPVNESYWNISNIKTQLDEALSVWENENAGVVIDSETSSPPT